MPNEIKKNQSSRLDSREFELPETTFVRDIENPVFQSIVLQCLAKIDGIGLTEGNFLDNILGRNATEGVKGIYAEQDSRTASIAIRIEVNIAYGVSIPQKAEEIQSRVNDEVTEYTGLHVSQVHVIFKNILHSNSTKHLMSQKDATLTPSIVGDGALEEFCDDFDA